MKSEEKKVYLIGNAHIDPVWLWRWQEGYAEVKATFRSALDRMKEYPYFKFTSACSIYYMWIEESDPEMFSEIAERVKEGRWCLVGGWLLQPDCNIPCGESFARHALISQRYFKEKFGKYVETGYNVDSFGHNRSLPMILKNSKMKNYVFMRPAPHEKVLEQNLFIWQSADGSSVKTFRIPFQYNIDMRRPEAFTKVPEIEGNSDMMAFYGVGNHGGGPTVELLNWMKENLGEGYVYSTPDEYFEKAEHGELPTLKDDLQYHAKGCYSACSEIKTGNRKCENALLESERFSILAGALAGTKYPKSELERAWTNVLFNQFHDILGGCSIKEAYEDARAFHGEALAISARSTNFALQKIAWNIDTESAEGALMQAVELECDRFKKYQKLGTPIVVFNSLDHPVSAISFVNSFGARPDYITDNSGSFIPSQEVRASKTNGKYDKQLVAFSAEIPAFGYKLFRLHFGKENAPTAESPFVCSENTIENELIRLTFDQSTGEISSFYLKKEEKELFSESSSTYLVDETHCDTWAHGVTHFDKVTDICKQGSVKVIESGPVRATVRTVQNIGNSSITRDYMLLANSERVTVKTKIDFREHHKMLKFGVNIDAKDTRSLCEIPFGHIERPIDSGEQVCEGWIALLGEKGGICIANDSKYSFDALGNRISLTVLRGAISADHYGERDEFCEFMDQGIHNFTYTLSPFRSVSESKRIADELNCPPVLLQSTFHSGSLPSELSYLSVSKKNITVTAIKAHSDSDSTVLRLIETEGIDSDFTVDLLGRSFDAHISAFSVKTFVISPDGSVHETDFIENIED